MLAPTLYFGETVLRSRVTPGNWAADTEIHQVRKVITMLDCGGARGRTKGHTVQVVSPQASAIAGRDPGVNDLVQDGFTWWVVEPKVDGRAAIL